ncbi:MAG: endonuclease MutS2 [Oscillospiraceae bacterium]|nr:endonuclease MutS2 [Oscillospiraceae bacterium]
MERHYKALELDKILAMLADCTASDDARELALGLRPVTDLGEAKREMQMTADANMLSSRFGTPGFYHIKNIKGMLKRAELGTSLSLRELLDVAAALRAIQSLYDWRRRCDEVATSLDYMFGGLSPQKHLEERITAAIVSEEMVADHASPALSDIRRKIRGAGLSVKNQLDKLIRSSTYQKFLQDSIVTMRDGRYVVPVKAEYRGEVKGLVHDTSSSGATVFVEPLGVVEANNEIRVLQAKEKAEIEHIIAELSAAVGEFSVVLSQDYDTLVELDLIFAKSKLADSMRASVPNLTGDGEIILKKSRHPMIDKNLVVPTNIYLGGAFDTLVITGPNTGGKTVSLKTLGLFTLMAMCGLMLPVSDGSQVRVFQRVLADIGDEQSIEQSLSTFSAHMTNIISILREADEETLVLIDELGAGTDPVEGAALAVAILESLCSRGAKVAATTHYSEIKLYALETEGVENACCEFDVASLRPTYKLSIGVPGRSNAFAISQRLGLGEEIIQRAQDLVSQENAQFEDVVSRLDQARQDLQKDLDEAQRLRREAAESQRAIDEYKERLDRDKEREMEKARSESRRIIETVRADAEKILDELEEIRRQQNAEDFAQKVTQAKSRLKGSVNSLYDEADPITIQNQQNYKFPRPLRKGDTVFVTGAGREGTVLSLADNAGNVQVQAGIMKLRVNQSTLRLVENTKPKKAPAGSVSKKVVSKSERAAGTEVDLRGMTAEEALMELDRYIDNAVMSSVPVITVIHGKGTGVLRNAVQQHLRRHRSVRSFRLGVYGEGESGVTIVELK